MSYYGSSGDVRADLNGGIPSIHDNYMGESQIPGELVERGRRWAYSLINAKLEERYGSSVPWTSGSEPNIVYEISNLLSQYFVISKQNLGNQPLDKNKKAELYDNPIEMLNDLSDGTMALPESINPLGDTAFFSHEDRTPTCDIDPIENNQIDPDRLDDIADERAS